MYPEAIGQARSCSGARGWNAGGEASAKRLRQHATWDGGTLHSALDGSPNKGANKKICKLATIVQERMLKGSRAANMGYDVEARYKAELGNTRRS